MDILSLLALGKAGSGGGGGGAVNSVNGQTGNVILTAADFDIYRVVYTADMDTAAVTCNKTANEIFTAMQSGKAVEAALVDADSGYTIGHLSSVVFGGTTLVWSAQSYSTHTELYVLFHTIANNNISIGIIGAVNSVNGQMGDVQLDANDVDAILAPSSPTTGDILWYNGSSWEALSATSLINVDTTVSPSSGNPVASSGIAAAIAAAFGGMGISEDPWIKLYDNTISEQSQGIDVSTDLNGNPFLYDELRVTVIGHMTGAASANITVNGESARYIRDNTFMNKDCYDVTEGMTVLHMRKAENGFISSYRESGGVMTSGSYSSAKSPQAGYLRVGDFAGYSRIKIWAATASGYFVSGTRCIVEGRNIAENKTKQNKFMSETITIATTDWVSGNDGVTATKSLTGMTADALVFLSYSDTTADYTVTQGNGTLTFAAASAPSAAVTVNVAWFV